jgi:hypothetical protein
VGKPEVKNHLEDQGIDGRITLKLIFKKWDREEPGLDLSGSAQGQVADPCEYVNEPSGVIKCGEFIDYLKN